MSKNTFSLESWLGIIALGSICVISLANVLVRYTTNASFAFTEEFSVFLIVILAFSGAAVAAKSNEHIRITLLEKHLGRTGRRIVYIIQWLGSLIVLSLIVWYGGLLAYEEFTWESTSPGLGYPTWIYLIWLPLLAVAIIFRSTQNLISRLKMDDYSEEVQQ